MPAMKGCRPLNGDEIKRIQLFAKEDLRTLTFAALGIATGFRLSELLSLRIGDVMNPDGTIVSAITVSARFTKTKESRTVPLNNNVKGVLRKWVGFLESKGYKRDCAIFIGRQTTRTGKSVTARRINQIFKALFEKAKIFGQTGTHMFRKTFAKNAKKYLKDIEKVAEALGHRRIESTLCYLSFDRGEIDNFILDANTVPEF